jgi:hypothetical protein
MDKDQNALELVEIEELEQKNTPDTPSVIVD